MKCICAISDCERPSKGYGFCNLHYQRWLKWGDPHRIPPPGPNSGAFKKGQAVSGRPFKKGQAAHNKGQPLSNETRAKLSQAMRGRVPSNKGVPASEAKRAKIRAKRALQIITPEHRAAISRGHSGKSLSPEHIDKISGPNNYRWKGGAKRNMSNRKWRTLRTQVMERDHYTCQACGRTGVVLVTHHIVPWDEGGPDELENLIAWCRRCHVRHHIAMRRSLEAKY